MRGRNAKRRTLAVKADAFSLIPTFGLHLDPKEAIFQQFLHDSRLQGDEVFAQELWHQLPIRFSEAQYAEDRQHNVINEGELQLGDGGILTSHVGG